MSKNTALKISEIPKCAVALMGSKDGRLLPSGSASLISPTLAVTAAHVIRDYEEHFGKTYKLVGAIAKAASYRVSDTARAVSGELATSNDVVIRASKKTAVFVECDLALIEFNEPFSPEGAPATIKLQPPEVGGEVAGYGFIRSEAELSNRAEAEIFWRQAAWMGAGLVTKLYLRGRDKLLPYPTLEAVDVDWPNGTSGGPILDIEGRLLGIVSRGVSAYKGEPPVSFGSLIWPITGAAHQLALTVNGNELQQGASDCTFDGLEHMWVSEQPGGTVYTSYHGPGAE